MESYAEKMYKRQNADWRQFNKNLIQITQKTNCNVMTAIEALDKSEGNIEKALTLVFEWSKVTHD